MIKKLIVVAMLIATFGIGSVTYAQDTGGSKGRSGRRNMSDYNERRVHRRHRRHRHGGKGQQHQVLKGANSKKPKP